ncbi:SusD/RagB family nutrient-binding outer membrane lipoprotein [uncultured Parabacteroides sp.]|uniref:SusD/RagB family nutrient-binding outer membrane lipoprotein n=1 Tax=uncultured Parabacteroides sp. TaxID=512312 RepID=UPI00280542A4|nr:SusD/RagB family nutrient-binding outer membrane lipoprotein [uncultured Parabacteroides sp.]
MKRVRSILYVILCAIMFGCSNFDDLNTNPNTVENATSSLLATSVILDMVQPDGYAANFIQDACLAKQMIWMEYLHDYNYNVLGRASFSGYTMLINANKMKELAAEQDREAYEALALLAKAYKLFYLSMQVGDIPFSNALQGELNNTKPQYDSQKEVMEAILEDLEMASHLFSLAHSFEGDPIFQGDVSKWEKVTNAFRLKVLMYLSKKENDPELNIKEQFARIFNNDPLMESNRDNLQLVFSDKSGQLYPYNKAISKHYVYATISSVVIDTLKAYNDYRLFYFAQPAATMIEKGLQPDNADAYIGLDPVADFSDVKSEYAKGAYSAINLRYIEIPSGEPYTRVGYAEQCFILAEAMLRGWISGNAIEYYNAGIKASMRFIAENTPDDELYHHGKKITEDYIDTYLNSESVMLKGGIEHQIKQIIIQKYLTYYMQYPFDAYYEYRRTGYPVLPINPFTNRNVEKDKIPVRWMYPTKEFDYNKENVDKAVASQYDGIDNNNKIMWILK